MDRIKIQRVNGEKKKKSNHWKIYHMQESKIILLPPANAHQGWKSMTDHVGFFLLPSWGKVNVQVSPLQVPLAGRSKRLCSHHTFIPPSHHPEPALERNSKHLPRPQPPALRSHGSVPLLPPHLCLALWGAAGSKLIYDYCEMEPCFM